jgi:hypothetical protein
MIAAAGTAIAIGAAVAFAIGINVPFIIRKNRQLRAQYEEHRARKEEERRQADQMREMHERWLASRDVPIPFVHLRRLTSGAYEQMWAPACDPRRVTWRPFTPAEGDTIVPDPRVEGQYRVEPADAEHDARGMFVSNMQSRTTSAGEGAPPWWGSFMTVPSTRPGKPVLMPHKINAAAGPEQADDSGPASPQPPEPPQSTMD